MTHRLVYWLDSHITRGPISCFTDSFPDERKTSLIFPYSVINNLPVEFSSLFFMSCQTLRDTTHLQSLFVVVMQSGRGSVASRPQTTNAKEMTRLCTKKILVCNFPSLLIFFGNLPGKTRPKTLFGRPPSQAKR